MISTKSIQVFNDDLAIDAYLATPQASGKFPAVIVIQEIFGVNEHIRDITERIAQQGYVAIAPAIYQRQAPGFEVGCDSFIRNPLFRGGMYGFLKSNPWG